MYTNSFGVSTLDTDKMSSYLRFMFDAAAFMKTYFSGPGQIYGLLVAYGLTPKEDTVGKWWQRKSVPTEWFAVILGVLELENGAPVRLVPFLVLT